MTVTNPRVQEEDLIGETLLLGLLGRVLYQYPENEQRTWFQSLIDTEAFSETPFAADQEDVIAGVALLQTWSKAGLTDVVYQDMQADYLRLFIGAGKVIAPPWESVFFSDARQTFQERTLQVRSWYRRFGLEPEKLYHEPDDHIGLEMTFLAHLGSQALQAIESDDQEKLGALLEARQDFLGEHLLKWGAAWCDLVIEHAHTDFYHGVARLTRGAFSAIAQQSKLPALQEDKR